MENIGPLLLGGKMAVANDITIFNDVKATA